MTKQELLQYRYIQKRIRRKTKRIQEVKPRRAEQLKVEIAEMRVTLKQLRERIKQECSNLTPLESQIIYLRYIRLKQWWEIEQILFYSTKQLERYEADALRKLLKDV